MARASLIAPIAISSLTQTIAVGGSESLIR